MRSRPRRVVVVGPGIRFLGGVTYYTYGLCRGLSDRCDVSAILMRRLLPARLYPGRRRVGAAISDVQLPSSVERFDGVDWFWVPSLFGALWFLVRRRPDTLILQWWTCTVLHTYLALALAARLLNVKIAVEFHEALDPGENAVGWVRRYAGLVAPWLFRLASGYVVHSQFDRRLIGERFGDMRRPVVVIPHATYDHYRRGGRRRDCPEECCNLLYFGLIRPYKGVDALVRAFDAIPDDEIGRYWLTIVGETWEGCTLPGELIARSRHRARITFVNRYVGDDDVDAFFGGADALVLPYHRSSQSGTLHIALHYGLPVVVTRVGGLAEAVEGYDGALLVDPGNPDALLAAIRGVAAWRGRRFAAPHDWAHTAARYEDFLAGLDGTAARGARAARATRPGGVIGLARDRRDGI